MKKNIILITILAALLSGCVIDKGTSSVSSTVSDSTNTFDLSNSTLIDMKSAVSNNSITLIDSSSYDGISKPKIADTISDVEKLFDQDISTYGDFYYGANSVGGYIIFDFHDGKAVELDGAKIQALAEEYTKAKGTVLKGSNNGHEWDVLTSAAEANANSQTLPKLSSITSSYRYIMLYNPNDWEGHISTLELYGKVVDTSASSSATEISTLSLITAGEIALIDSSDQRTSSDTSDQVGKIFDKDDSTSSRFYNGTSNSKGYIAFDFDPKGKGKTATITNVDITADSGKVNKFENVVVQGTNDISGGNWVTISTSAKATLTQNLTIASNDSAYRYIRVFSRYDWYGAIAELKLYGAINE